MNTIERKSYEMNNTINRNVSDRLDTLINTPINNILSSKNSLPSNSITDNKYSNLESNNLLKKSSRVISNTYSFLNYKIVIFILLLILILSFFGINIFKYLSYIVDYISNLLKPLISKSSSYISNVLRNILSVSSVGSKKIIDTGSETSKNIIDTSSKGLTSGINLLENNLKHKKSIVNPENENILSDDVKNKEQEPAPVKSSSSTSGYCFIGKINDIRSCAKVTSKEQCMSGDIYPTKDICINPKLRI
tara:strand:- start:14002 stop:14748 length:747 start_codon:yes stop_codon:yes gene_type:complete